MFRTPGKQALPSHHYLSLSLSSLNSNVTAWLAHQWTSETMSCLWPGWGTRCMNYLPVYCFAWLCIDSSLPITSSSSSGGGSSGSMSTNNPLRRHALLPPDKPEEGWGQEKKKKKKSKPSPSCSQLISSPPFQPLTAHVPLLFVVLAIFPVLLSSISPPHSSCTCLLVLPHSVCYNSICATNTLDRDTISQLIN